MIKRSYKPELMDLGPSHYTQDEYFDCINKLGTIGKLLGGNRATRKALRQVAQDRSIPLETSLHDPQGDENTQITSVLDVGCGNGSNTLEIARLYPNARVVGIDIAHDAIIGAEKFKKLYEQKNNLKLHNLFFEHRTQPELNEQAKSFDIVTVTLLCHHLNDQELINFLQAACSIARRAVIINDLQRSSLAYILFWLVSPLFNNRLIRYDGLLSIKRSFTRQELQSYLSQAGIAPENYTITWRWAFRWVITITG